MWLHGADFAVYRSLQLLISGASFHAAIVHLNPTTSAFDRGTRLILWAILFLNFVIVVFTCEPCHLAIRTSSTTSQMLIFYA